MHRTSRIFVTGHTGLVGSSVLRMLSSVGYNNILTATRATCDLRDQNQVNRFFRDNSPEYVIHAAGTVGGILANQAFPADFAYDNVMMQAAVLHSACTFNVKKLLYLGSSCVYPKECQQPIKEEYLLSGPLEPTNEAYAIAKILGVRSCSYYRTQYGCNFISAMPCNLYGPNDNFNNDTSHVLPALIKKFHKSRETGTVELWGTGSALREFMHVDDLANALLYLMNYYDEPGHINVGTGTDIAIKELADLIATIVAPGTKITFDATKPDGTPRKLLDCSKLLGMGWQPTIKLADGIQSTYNWYLDHLRNRSE